MESAAHGFSVFSAFFFWAACSTVTTMLLMLVGLKTLGGIALAQFMTLAAVFILLSNALVELLTEDSSSEAWMVSSITIGTIVFFLLAQAGPRILYERLGVGYIRCEYGSVFVDKSAADDISRVLPDAIDGKQPMPAKIQKYDVEIVSRIGKEMLLELGRPGERRQPQKVFVPTESIIYYRERPDA